MLSVAVVLLLLRWCDSTATCFLVSCLPVSLVVHRVPPVRRQFSYSLLVCLMAWMVSDSHSKFDPVASPDLDVIVSLPTEELGPIEFGPITTLLLDIIQTLTSTYIHLYPSVSNMSVSRFTRVMALRSRAVVSSARMMASRHGNDPDVSGLLVITKIIKV